jgi:hypothetical protein
MSSIFIYDIASGTWATQKVTDLNGHIVEDGPLGFKPSIAVPQKRFNTCATAGSSQDKTSHNIFILGGQNETYTISDAWVLSLPRWVTQILAD